MQLQALDFACRCMQAGKYPVESQQMFDPDIVTLLRSLACLPPVCPRTASKADHSPLLMPRSTASLTRLLMHAGFCSNCTADLRGIRDGGNVTDQSSANLDTTPYPSLRNVPNTTLASTVPGKFRLFLKFQLVGAAVVPFGVDKQNQLIETLTEVSQDIHRSHDGTQYRRWLWRWLTEPAFHGEDIPQLCCMHLGATSHGSVQLLRCMLLVPTMHIVQLLQLLLLVSG